MSDVALAGVTGRAEFEAVGNDIVCTEELNDLELTQAIVARIQQIEKESEANEDSYKSEALSAPQVKRSKAESAISLLQGYVLHQVILNEVLQLLKALEPAVEESAMF